MNEFVFLKFLGTGASGKLVLDILFLCLSILLLMSFLSLLEGFRLTVFGKGFDYYNGSISSMPKPVGYGLPETGDFSDEFIK